ncbi:hypothetical protein PV327_006132 [Microctonus hyperodae]|uniref:Uncharacterized protein n=1 Tax=Microctonus hyperodae TaxID=165561 RepID=A0AA39G4B9_MICHY|nr:hypothetical protein PV327_006132 [Microctonus hyperodae]
MFQLSWTLFATQFSLSLLLITPSVVNSYLHQSKDSLRDALDILARKQRSLDISSHQLQNYYNPLTTIKYADVPIIDDDDDDDDDNNDDDEDDLNFIFMNDSDELNGINKKNFQRINDIKFIMDSLRNLKSRLKIKSSHHNNEPSLFRERERIGSHKRDTGHLNVENKNYNDLTQSILNTLHNSPLYNNDAFDDTDEYPGSRTIPANDLSIEMFQPLFSNKYKDDQRDEINFDNGRQSFTQLSPSNTIAKQIAMVHYPISREYKNSMKRFPIAKRSENIKKLSDLKSSQEAKDPEVAQDLKSLFGTHTILKENLTTFSNIHNHNSNHINNKMEHNYKRTNVNKFKRMEYTTTNFPTGDMTKRNNSGQDEIEPTIISSMNNIEDKLKIKKNKIKKSIDWSEYFGIDRRRKKTELLARPGTQDQDDEWLLQKYYTIISENLRHNHLLLLNNDNKTKSDESDDNGGEKRDKFEQIDERLKNVKNLIMKDPAMNSMSDNNPEVDSQQFKDVIMARLAAAYSLDKMRRALNDFKNSIGFEYPTTTSQKSIKYEDNNLSNKHINQNKRQNINNSNMKYSAKLHYDNHYPDLELYNECSELSRIETSCEFIERRGSYSLFIPCVMYKICRLCDNKKLCAIELLMEANRICDSNFDARDSLDLQKQCLQHAFMILQMRPLRIITETPNCYNGILINSCLRHYQHSNRPMQHHNINDDVNKDLNPISDQRWI